MLASRKNVAIGLSSGANWAVPKVARGGPNLASVRVATVATVSRICGQNEILR